MSGKFFIPVGKEHICAEHFSPKEIEGEAPSRTLLIMAHDFPGAHRSSHGDLFGRVANIAVQAGIHALRFDFRGCGESEGRPEQFTIAAAHEDFEAVLGWARDQKFERLAFAGEGLGATIALCAPRESVFAMLLFWPVLDTAAVATRRFQAPDALAGQDNPSGYIMSGEDKVGLPLLADMMALRPETYLADVAVPVLIQHGGQDELVPADQLDLARTWFRHRRVEITVYQDGAHALPGKSHRRYMYFHISEFLKKYA